jgi:hypothetical protein
MSYKKAALIGIIFLLAVFSLTIAWGRKPKAEQVIPTLRELSTDEIKAVTANIPTKYLIPSEIKSVLQDMGKDNDREMVLGILKLSEINGIKLLNDIYPDVRFYKGFYAESLSEEPFVYLLALTDDDCYFLPEEFNRLLRKKNIKISDRNMISLAKVIVILTLGKEPVKGLEGISEKELVSFPKITFLEGKRINEMINEKAYMTKLKVENNQQIEDWFFNISYGSFVVILRGDSKEPNKKYSLPLYGGVKMGPWWRGK